MSSVNYYRQPLKQKLDILPLPFSTFQNFLTLFCYVLFTFDEDEIPYININEKNFI